ncbi:MULTISPECIES: DNA ligase D [Ramlibacter]|uniref:DNA ligase (ATP) n=1 Tax=Ramlibacter pinisoli TaxID=2682844 RepID=A0A6N8J2R0_9BURK|nr:MULTISPECIES: DNA ligase D [Ramlibacter]MBA2962601.1 DNA ligase D [Ramlibacter sp. CGMCC 1.13660]MVQ32543.1 DNA ligase D [Ramlibacter pinisoli]
MAADDRPPSPAEALKTYKAKRRFDATPEPAEGGVADESARAFVIQKHWATRLHYDFRLELDGTMKSWAVPKGPSYDPHDKRMAMPTEDHPIAYNRFEGTIPAGNYGAGKVVIWDKGTWVPLEDPHQGFRDGKLKFELRGHKMHGHWALVRMKGRAQGGRQDPWLLIKERDGFVRPATEFSVVDELPDSVQDLDDRPAAVTPSGGAVTAPAPAPPARSGPPAGARPAALPATLQPQLAVLVDGPPADPQAWVFEIKFDGYRMLARAEGGTVRLVTRNGHDWTARLPALQQALQAMDLPDGWYDGEIIMPGQETPADFQALQGAFDSAHTEHIVYYLFDLPFCAGQDLRQVPLVERRAVLQRIVERKPHPNVRFSAVFEAPPKDILASACQLGLEGLIAKRRESSYAGRRSSDWIKLKCGRRQEFVIGGWTDPKGSRAGIGSLLLGMHGDDGKLRYAGNVGTGFDDRTLRALRQRLDGLEAPRSPFDGGGSGLPRGSHWVRPELVCEVAFGEMTREGKVRHSVFHGLRDDKPAAAVSREQALHLPVARRKAAAPAPAPAATAAALPAGLRVSHPERVVDARSGITKIELVRYYALVAPLMLEHLWRRPIAMVRAPDGVDGQQFFQKHLDRYRMEGVAALDPKMVPGHPAMLEIVAPAGLLSAAQMNVIEFHTWNAVATAADKPDRMTFDLDPGEGVDWPQMQEAAQLVHAFLHELGLPGWLKTSGGKGLHVVVPIKPQHGWDPVKDFSQAVVQHLARTIPQRFVAKSGPKNRVGRIFIDYLRNGFGATTVCAWSARARPGLGISVPVHWDELAHLKGGDHWTVATVHQRLDAGNSPWDGYARSALSINAAMKKLGFRPA